MYIITLEHIKATLSLDQIKEDIILNGFVNKVKHLGLRYDHILSKKRNFTVLYLLPRVHYKT